MISLPGSKSIAQRMLLLAALSPQKTEIHLEHAGEDIKILINALKKVGIRIEEKKESITVYGGPWKSTQEPIHFKENATGLRLFLGAALGQNCECVLDGDPALKKRPLKELLDSFREVGAKIKGDKLPIQTFPSDRSHRTLDRTIKIPGKFSSQWASSAAFYYFAQGAENSEIKIDGPLVSSTYFELTKKQIQNWQETAPKSCETEADFSAAAPFLLWSFLSGRSMKFSALNPKSYQADRLLFQYAKKLGATLQFSSKKTLLTPPENLSGFSEPINGGSFPDGVISLVLLAAFLPTRSVFYGLEHLEWKESNRLAALEKALEVLGARMEKIVKNDKTEWQIHPRKSSSKKDKESIRGTLDAQNDHRLIMNFSILAKVFPNIIVKNIEGVEKSFPNFWTELEGLVKTSIHFKPYS